MALRAAPTSDAPLGASLTVLRRPDRRTEAEELRLELVARQDEAVELVDGLAPMVSALITGCIHLGPRHHQLALTVRDRLDRYRRQNTDQEPEGEAA